MNWRLKPFGHMQRTLLFLLALGLLSSWPLPSEEVSSCEEWKKLANEYREISNELAAELTMYQKEFPKLLTITASLQEKLTDLSQTSNQILERQKESLMSSQTTINEVKVPLNDLSEQISGLKSSLDREIRTNTVLSYAVVTLIGLTVVETGILLLK